MSDSRSTILQKNEKTFQSSLPSTNLQKDTIQGNNSFFKRIETKELNKLFLSYFEKSDTKTAAAFVKTSKNSVLSTLFREEILLPKIQEQVKILCQAVVYSDFFKVEAMLDKHPYLLLYRARVKDYSFHEEISDQKDNNTEVKSYRECEGTPLQLALMTEDICVLNDDKSMVKLISDCFVKIFKDEKSSQHEIQRQVVEVFPGGDVESKEEKIRKQKDQAALQKVITGVESHDSKKRDAALQEFRDYLKPKEVITKGKVFNDELLLAALKFYYDEKRYYSRGQDINKLMWCGVIGSIQRYFPASYAKAYKKLYLFADNEFDQESNGLYYLLTDKSKFVYAMLLNGGMPRDARPPQGAVIAKVDPGSFRIPYEFNLFPLDAHLPQLKIGYNCAMESRQGLKLSLDIKPCYWPARKPLVAKYAKKETVSSSELALYKAFLDKKNNSFRSKLKSYFPRAPEPKSSCVIA